MVFHSIFLALRSTFEVPSRHKKKIHDAAHTKSDAPGYVFEDPGVVDLAGFVGKERKLPAHCDMTPDFRKTPIFDPNLSCHRFGSNEWHTRFAVRQSMLKHPAFIICSLVV